MLFHKEGLEAEMPKITSRVLLLSVLLTSSAVCQSLRKEEVVRLITAVQQMPTSRLDPALPTIPLQQWLRLELPKNSIVRWAVHSDPDSRIVRQRHLPWVEASVPLHGRPLGTLLVSMGGISPAVEQIFFDRNGEFVDIKRLRDFPPQLKKLVKEPIGKNG